jgi:hypothetical protein
MEPVKKQNSFLIGMDETFEKISILFENTKKELCKTNTEYGFLQEKNRLDPIGLLRQKRTANIMYASIYKRFAERLAQIVAEYEELAEHYEAQAKSKSPVY